MNPTKIVLDPHVVGVCSTRTASTYITRKFLETKEIRFELEKFHHKQILDDFV